MRALRLEQYAAAFEEQGFDDLRFILQLSEEGLVAMCQVVAMKSGHRMKLLDMLPAYEPV